jgi:hypothetical protein
MTRTKSPKPENATCLCCHLVFTSHAEGEVPQEGEGGQLLRGEGLG